MSSSVALSAESLASAREALWRLYTKALGSDFANEHEVRKDWIEVDDALDALEATPPIGTAKENDHG